MENKEKHKIIYPCCLYVKLSVYNFYYSKIKQGKQLSAGATGAFSGVAVSVHQNKPWLQACSDRSNPADFLSPTLTV